MKTATEEDDQEDEFAWVTTLTEQEWIISEDENQSPATPGVLQLGATAGQGQGTSFLAGGRSTSSTTPTGEWSSAAETGTS